MANNNLMQIDKDMVNKKITITREFEAPLDLVWRTFSEGELLDEWWAPEPWKAKTKTMKFEVGGSWIYAMMGPDGSKHFSRVDFKKIVPLKSIESTDCFCDESGNPNLGFPTMYWRKEFESAGEITRVIVRISFEKEADIKTIVEMGFEAGFTAALGNLDRYLEAQFKLRNQLKTNTMARTSTYLNFPGNAEEAFTSYKKIFKAEFSGQGLQRFGDLPAEAGTPPVPDAVKKLVLHVEMQILGGHILMATDAPKEMGMSVTLGNNMYICLEPETKMETKRLFDALSAGGNVIMPLDDMFWGAYFGTCTDKFGINWMFNCIEKK